MAALSKQKLKRWQSLQTRRLAAQRRAKSLAAQQEPLETEFLDHVRLAGGEARALVVHGFRVSIDREKCNVKWAAAFEEALGQARAEELRQSAPLKDVLVVEQLTAEL
jgi:hypothetical protein